MNDFNLSTNEKMTLLEIARVKLATHLELDYNSRLKVVNLTPELKKHCGAFVSIHNSNQLRGCIGAFQTNDELHETVARLVIESASCDNRFSSVRANEFVDLLIEISVLSPLNRIYSINEFEYGKHGIYIKSGFSHGTFLPQVAEKMNWTKEEFLGYCSRDKARIGWDGWKTAELFTYEAIVFDESLFSQNTPISL